eukprot:4098713-Amphidinium_carterae.1
MDLEASHCATPSCVRLKVLIFSFVLDDVDVYSDSFSFENDTATFSSAHCQPCAWLVRTPPRLQTYFTSWRRARNLNNVKRPKLKCRL